MRRSVRATVRRASGALAGDLGEPAIARAAVAERPDVIFHLAAIVSGETELDFEKGMHVNFDGSRALLEAIRAIGDGYHPRFVFASSIAVLARPFRKPFRMISR